MYCVKRNNWNTKCLHPQLWGHINNIAKSPSLDPQLVITNRWWVTIPGDMRQPWQRPALRVHPTHWLILRLFSDRKDNDRHFLQRWGNMRLINTHPHYNQNLTQTIEQLISCTFYADDKANLKACNLTVYELNVTHCRLTVRCVIYAQVEVDYPALRCSLT